MKALFSLTRIASLNPMAFAQLEVVPQSDDADVAHVFTHTIRY